MTEILNQEALRTDDELILPQLIPATDEDILAYLRHSQKFSEIAALAERDSLILQACEQFNLSISDQEWQAAGDEFRAEQRLLSSAETLQWLAQQRITVEDWSQGIKIRLLTQKLKDHLFGELVDNDYLNDRERYKQVVISHLLVVDLAKALDLMRQLQENYASFCVLALEHSKGKQSKENGGFMGVRFLSELMPEIAQAIAQAKEGEIVGPVQTHMGYHIIKVEQWLPMQLTENLRDKVFDLLLETWLKRVRELTRFSSSH